MSLIGKPPSRTLTETELVKELPFWRTTGRQDAGNTMGPAEIAEEVGKTPSAAAIKRWLLDQGSPPDVDDYMPTGVTATPAQKRRLHDAWADGWSEYAAGRMREYAKEMEEYRKAEDEERVR